MILALNDLILLELFCLKVPPNITFFLVDGRSFYRDLIVQSLSNLGFQGRCIINKSYNESVEKLQDVLKKGEKIDFIISELELPDGSGIDLINKVRKIEKLKNVPILLASAAEDLKLVVEAFEAGTDSYLLKPIEEATFVEKLEYCWLKRKGKTH